MERMNPTLVWNSLSFTLHKVAHILKATACVSEGEEPRNETINTLAHLALDHVEEARESVDELHREYYRQLHETAQDTHGTASTSGEEAPLVNTPKA